MNGIVTVISTTNLPHVNTPLAFLVEVCFNKPQRGAYTQHAQPGRENIVHYFILYTIIISEEAEERKDWISK